MTERITKEMIMAGALAQFEQMNGKRPSDPCSYDSAEDFVDSLKWYDGFYADAFPRYLRNFEHGLRAAISALRNSKKAGENK